MPSGVSYMLSSRKVMKQIFPALFRKYGVRPIEQYSQALLSTLRSLAPDGRSDSDHRAAHAGRLQLGLLRARLPGPPDGHRAGRGPRPRRPRQHRLHADDQGAAAGRRDLPPRRRRLPRSAGVPRSTRRSASPGCSAPIAPATSRWPTRSAPASPTTRRSTPTCRRSSSYYLDQDPILANVETLLMTDDAQRAHVTDRLEEFVVKAVGESGGYGMLIGPHSSREQRVEMRDADPGRSAQLHRAAGARRCRPRRASSTARSSRATSICGPTCCSARRRRSCRAG